MRHLTAALLWMITALAAVPAAAQSYFEPERGSELRTDILDAIRPHAVWALDAPIQFIVHEIRTDGATAFVRVTAQRPGGGAIYLEDTPLKYRDREDVEYMDGPTIQALLVKQGRMWVAVRHQVGATEAWWHWDVYCPTWGNVLDDFCR